ncbi:MAG: PAS domain-containing protein [Opitutae bacterium]|nr:PAS domain-containing protein [Opitutae bacterium]
MNSVTAPPFPLTGIDAALSDAARDRLLAAILAHAPTLVAIFDAANSRALYLNDFGRRWLTAEPTAKLHAFTLPDIFGVRSLDLLNNTILPHTQVLGGWRGACELRDVWGSETSVELAMLKRVVDGQPYYCVAATRLPTTAAIHAAYDRELLQALLETVHDQVYFKDRNSRFLRVSRSLAKKDGCAEPSALIGKTDFDRFTAEHAQPAFEMEQTIMRTGDSVLDVEEKEVWPDGRVSWVSTSKFPLRDSEGEIVGTFGISRNITEQKLAEAERREMEAQRHLAQRMESIGGLAAGIAHEINTPTQFVTDNVHFLRRSFAQLADLLKACDALRAAATASPELREQAAAVAKLREDVELDYLLTEIPQTLTQSLEGLQRVARIVGSLKEFSHPNNAHSSTADLNHVIETAVNVTRHEWKYVAEVVCELAPDLPTVPCVVDEFNQVMLNLIVNASHAIGDALKQCDDGSVRGKITIRTRREDDWVEVEVEDTGTGIPEAHRARIFEPFFTTKEVGRGTGQGLTIVHRVIVKRHHGTVNFDTEIGRGTVFKIRLPLAGETCLSAAPETNSAP